MFLVCSHHVCSFFMCLCFFCVVRALFTHDSFLNNTEIFLSMILMVRSLLNWQTFLIWHSCIFFFSFGCVVYHVLFTHTLRLPKTATFRAIVSLVASLLNLEAFLKQNPCMFLLFFHVVILCCSCSLFTHHLPSQHRLFSDNMLSGEIPSELGALPEINNMYVSFSSMYFLNLVSLTYSGHLPHRPQNTDGFIAISSMGQFLLNWGGSLLFLSCMFLTPIPNILFCVVHHID